MKRYIQFILGGLAIVIIVFVVMKYISLDLRIITLISGLFFSIFAYLKSHTSHLSWLSILLLITPLSIGFILGIIPELPNMYWAVIYFILMTVLGFYAKKYKFLLIGILVLTMFPVFIVPKIVEGDLSQLTNEPAPEIELVSLDTNEMTDFKSFEGKVIILDFFGTWCAPCIKEMYELKKIRVKYGTNPNVEFILVCTQYGKDTPEKAKKFLQNHDLRFQAYFDLENKIHKKLNFSGVPALVIIDKKGNVRFKHEGYNESENLDKVLTNNINKLL